MLVHLAVNNLGVLGGVEIDPSPGFTAITGETGTGKTLLLGGIRQLLGEPANSGLVGPLGEETTVDGLFDVGGDAELGVSRTIPRHGRSRTRIDGAIVSAETVRNNVSPLIEIIGQHDQLFLRRTDHLRRMIDSSMTGAGSREIQNYQKAWTNYQASLELQAKLGGDLTTLSRELDLARHQVQEIASAKLSPGLDIELERDVSRLRNIEEIQENLGSSSDLAEQVTELSGEIVARLRKVAEYDDALEKLRDDAESLAVLGQDFVSASRTAIESQDADPGALTILEERLTAIGDLKRKYGRTLDDVIEFGIQISERADELESLLEHVGTVGDRVESDHAELVTVADQLSAERLNSCNTLSLAMSNHLGELGMAAAVVRLELTRTEPNSSGADRVQMLYASDERLEPRPVSDVASGGELSRLVLAFRLAVSTDSSATLVFDEVDAGVGGQTATAMGDKLADLAQTTQVLCVTHLAQVASRADRHYVVSRGEDGVATVERVEDTARVEAIATLMSGHESVAGIAAAKEMLDR